MEQEGGCFNESTGRGQQLVVCVCAGRIRPSCWTCQSPSQHPLYRLSSIVHSAAARPGAGPKPRGPAGEPAPEPEQNQVQPLSHSAGWSLSLWTHRAELPAWRPLTLRFFWTFGVWCERCSLCWVGKRETPKKATSNRIVGQYEQES